MAIQNITNSIADNNITYGHHHNHDNPHQKARKRVQTVSALSSALGVATTVAIIAKKQGFSLNPSRIARTPIKDLAIFKITDETRPNGRVLKLKAPQILGIGAGSVTGGLIGGSLVDKKENIPAKCSEAVSQFIGDISIPLAFVAGPTMLYKNFEELAQKQTSHLKLQNISKFIQGNKILRILCPTLVSGISLGAGILAGNKTSNIFNEHVHGVKQERGIRVTDFAPHLDDVCLAITLMADKSPVGDIISKFVPVALSVAGFETGTANQKNRIG